VARCTLPTRAERGTERDAVPWQINEQADAERVASRDRQPARSTAVYIEDIVTALALQLDNTGTDYDRTVGPTDTTQNEEAGDPCTVASIFPDRTTTRPALVDLDDHHPLLSNWLPIAAALTGTDLSTLDRDENGNTIDIDTVRSQTATIGTLPEQVSLRTSIDDSEPAQNPGQGWPTHSS
jgi:hypothetical protein